MFEAIKDFGKTVAEKAKSADFGKIGRIAAGCAAFVGSAALAVVATRNADEQIIDEEIPVPEAPAEKVVEDPKPKPKKASAKKSEK